MHAVNVSISGRVQGVGFRPFVYQLAHTYHLAGTVQNNMDGVKIIAEGTKPNVQQFLLNLQSKAPRLSHISNITVVDIEPIGATDFIIIDSKRSGTSSLVIPIDSAVCDDCLQEMNDKTNFRYEYPFINCTQCGPRYTIIAELPYDRPYTTMKDFTMCSDCQREYEDPTNRRHHAQPIACPACGPKVTLLDQCGHKLEMKQPIQQAVQLMQAGHILAIKGLGGYHLCCDATNEQAVELLRKRKNRPARPLAVMAASLSVIDTFAYVNEAEKKLLKSPEAPIVIVKKKEGELAENIAPNMKTVGVMLPYTPLHHLLFKYNENGCFVMTSANPSGMPILYKDNEALTYLDGIADYFLVHDRDILHPVDDSVVQVNDDRLDFFRRARGYVPDPFVASHDVSGIVAFGGQQKTTFTIGRNEQVFLGPHIGDLENVETMSHYWQEYNHLMKWLDTEKDIAVIDAHPNYITRQLIEGFHTVLEVQHHHAHMAACMEEHHLTGKAYGVILDGTGYGLDGNIWGFEIFYGDASSAKRLAHLQYTPLPGGEVCIREPWRNAVAMLLSLLGEEGGILANALFPDKEKEIHILKKMIENHINIIQAGTCGRLFDAVSALCGTTEIASYDGEAAILLSELVDETCVYEPYSYEYIEDELVTIQMKEMIKGIVRDVLAGEEVANISGRFHETVVQSILTVIERIATVQSEQSKTVVLGGGSLHNRYLRKRLREELTKREFTVYVPEQVPCNDGGLSYGQLAVAAAKRRGQSCV
ncbi:carbamoyltransferase HypF [Bacillus sp. 123MFChir2]|uniref:carbamoyltransferase HypF n=1 Tax=Bacillus sp. 123MFChir2 TaxID=1169144 RepID=UPI00035D991E|nr:carbamoyltransferase HypF [Bacillus sp. 123MFChir2]